VTRIGIKRADGRIDDERNSTLVRRLAQSVDQLDAGAARQAVHPPRGVARIVEVVNDRKWQSIPIRKPFDGQSSLLRYQVDERRVRLVMRLALEVGCK
jgi:hypothetical protein